MTTTMRAIVGVLVLLLGLGISGTVSAATAQFSEEDALQYGEVIGIDWETSPFDAAQFAAGMNVELEHGARDIQTDVTGDDPTMTAKVAYAHLKEFPDYYFRLEVLEESGDSYWDPYAWLGSEKQLFQKIRQGAKKGQVFNNAQARKYGDLIGVEWGGLITVEQFRMGMDIELEHGARDAQTDVTGNDPTLTAKIAYAHLKEFPDYYYRLYIMEKEADAAAAGVSLVI